MAGAPRPSYCSPSPPGSTGTGTSFAEHRSAYPFRIISSTAACMFYKNDARIGRDLYSLLYTRVLLRSEFSPAAIALSAHGLRFDSASPMTTRRDPDLRTSDAGIPTHRDTSAGRGICGPAEYHLVSRP